LRVLQCRNCGAEIADKALICYKCGTATTEAKYKPTTLPTKRSGPNLIVIVIIAALVLATIYYFAMR